VGWAALPHVFVAPPRQVSAPMDGAMALRPRWRKSLPAFRFAFTGSCSGGWRSQRFARGVAVLGGVSRYFSRRLPVVSCEGSDLHLPLFWSACATPGPGHQNTSRFQEHLECA